MPPALSFRFLVLCPDDAAVAVVAEGLLARDGLRPLPPAPEMLLLALRALVVRPELAPPRVLPVPPPVLR